MTKYVYITSCGHSGSTLLDLLLGAHSKSFSIGEIKQWERYIKNDLNCCCNEKVVQCSFWQEVRKDILKKKRKRSFQDAV